MVAVLSDRAYELLADLPPYLADDPFIQGLYEQIGIELQRIEDFARQVQDEAFPANATDEFGMLTAFELMLRLPANVAGATAEQRRISVLTNIRRRNAVSGLDWVELLSQAMGTTEWTYQEGPGDYQVTINIPYAPGVTSTLVESLARRVTPAHLEVIAVYSGGFILGYSQSDPQGTPLT